MRPVTGLDVPLTGVAGQAGAADGVTGTAVKAIRSPVAGARYCVDKPIT